MTVCRCMAQQAGCLNLNWDVVQYLDRNRLCTSMDRNTYSRDDPRSPSSCPRGCASPGLRYIFRSVWAISPFSMRWTTSAEEIFIEYIGVRQSTNRPSVQSIRATVNVSPLKFSLGAQSRIYAKYYSTAMSMNIFGGRYVTFPS